MSKNIHFRRIPDHISRELNGIKAPFVVVSTTLRLSFDDIARGKYRKLGITMRDGQVSHTSSLVPYVANGYYSKYNRYGRDIVLKHLPKVYKTYYWETPNFGDPSKGYHGNSRTVQTWQHKFIAPRDWALSFEILKSGEDYVLMKVSVETIFDRNQQSFNDDLFFAINLLQENVGDCHVFNAYATTEDYLRVTMLGWEIFPPGSLDRAIEKVKSQIRNLTPEKAKRIEDRAKFMDQLKPIETFVGLGMNSKYFGAKFRDDLVAFENADYGNAIYLLFGNWEELSKKSRTEILQRPDKDFVRIPHTRYWKLNLKSELRRRIAYAKKHPNTTVIEKDKVK